MFINNNLSLSQSNNIPKEAFRFLHIPISNMINNSMISIMIAVNGIALSFEYFIIIFFF